MPGRGDTFRWLLVAILVFALFAFFSYARGVEHHRGQQVGAQAAAVVTTAPDGRAAHGHG